MPVQGSGTGDPHSNYPIDDPSLRPSGGSNDDSGPSDLNLLLLLQPSKKVRDLGRLADSVENREAISQETRDALQEFGLTLINDPQLPPGTKEALARWIAALANYPTTPTQDADGDGKADKPDLLPTGMDPNLLAMDGPDLLKSTKALGDIATAMASSQGGTLTMDEINALVQQANDLLADPNLPQADREALENFKAELMEYPIADMPETAGETTLPSTSDTTNPQGAERAHTGQPNFLRAATTNPNGAPATAEPNNLLMDDPALSQEIKDLGTQAKAYALSNNGPLTKDQITQLRGEAQALIDQGAIDPDLAALQEFLKTLDAYPSIANAAKPTGLLLTQPGLNPKLINLAQYADLMARAQNGTLTPDEVALLQGMAAELMQELPNPADKEILKKWVEVTLANFPVRQPPSLRVFSEAMLFGQTAGHNPYMEPGIMAMLAPILSELFVIYTDIIKQSSKLKQNMFKLMIAMAKEAYDFAIAAGKAKANQLQNDADKFFAMGLTQCLQAGLSMATFVGQKAYTAKNAGKLHDQGYETPDNLKGADAGKQAAAQKLSKAEFVNRAEMSSIPYFMNQLTGTLGGAVTNMVQSAYTAKNVGEAMDEAQNNAMKDMISQLMQLLQQTIQSSSDEMASAQKAWEGFVQLYKDFAQTITQGIYRS